MDKFIFLVTLISLTLQLVFFYKRLGLKNFAHPGFYFAVIWWVAVISQYVIILTISDWPFFPYPEYVNELNIYVSFTSFSFTLVLLFSNLKKSELSSVSFNFLDHKIYTIVVYITFLGAILKLLFIWNELGVGFNLGAIRLAYTEDKGGVVGGDNFLYSLILYMNYFYSVITIIAGYYLGLLIQKKPSPVASKWLITLPMVITIIYVFSIGGRNPLAVGIKYYLIGFSLSLAHEIASNVKLRILYRTILISIIFVIFTTFVGDQRSKTAGHSTFSSNFQSSLLQSTSGIMEYMGAHYWGYQLRNNDTFDPNRLGYGYYTFNGLLNLNIPFSRYIGLNTNLSQTVGFENNVLDYQYLYNKGFVGYYTTRSVFMEMKMDFGYTGTFFFIFLFVLYTHYIFRKIHVKNTVNLLSLLPFFFCFNYWASSNFQSVYAVGIYNFVLIFWIYGLLLSRRKKNFS